MVHPFGADPDAVANRLYLRIRDIVGPNVARMSIRHFAIKKLGLPPEQVPHTRAGELCEALRPLLRSMLGEAQADRLIKELQS